MTTQIKAQNLKGFRDFLPEEAILRKKVTAKVTEVFEKFGYDPLETPALEYAETLLGKYGEDADKLLFLFQDRGERNVGMRYDQTVPLARVVSQYTELPKPFKRYQIQPVWRAENTQKGRYREFLQCDADIIGDSYAPAADAELVALFWNIYKTLGFTNIKIAVNSRPILRKLIEDSLNRQVEATEFLSIVRSLDKLDKIEKEGVTLELRTKGLTDEEITNLFARITDWLSYDYKQVLSTFPELGLSIQMAIENFGVPQEVITFNPTLARGLDYYTGIIFEAMIPGVKGSLGGGGRYDNLIKQFTGQDIPAVGFAIGFDRTVEAIKDLGLMQTEKTVTKVLVAYIDDGKDVLPTALKVANTLREAGIQTELFLNPQAKFDKQLRYADRKGIPYVVVIGEEEVTTGNFKLKNMSERTERALTLPQLISALQ